MEKIIQNKKKNNVLLFENGICFKKLKKNLFRDFLLKTKNFSLYNKFGNYTLNKNNSKIIKHLRQLGLSRRSWKKFQFKKRYLLKKRYKRKHFRLKNYVQKYILYSEFKKYFRFYSLYLRGIRKYNLKSNFEYQPHIYEFLSIKTRVLKICLFNFPIK